MQSAVDRAAAKRWPLARYSRAAAQRKAVLCARCLPEQAAAQQQGQQ